MVERIWEVQLEVVMLEGSIAEEDGQEDRVTVEVREGELMLYDE